MKPKATPVSEKTTMKKLNITKEQFNRSNYFQRKYGKLEYVSESGKLFKTDKGKVLKFNESIKDIAPGIQDWGTTVYVEPLEVEMSWDDVYYIVKKDCRRYPLLEEELGLEPYEEPDDEQIREWIETKPKSFMNYLKEFGTYGATDFSRDDEYDESTKKFGRKFNESFADMGKQKFMSVLEDELGLTDEDEIEEWVEGIDENWDLANDLMMKLLDGKSLDRTEQIQVAYFLADKLENHF